MFKRRGPTYTDYGSDAPPQRLRAKFWLSWRWRSSLRSCGTIGLLLSLAANSFARSVEKLRPNVSGMQVVASPS
jgi:hypothetical protein